jgi:hypothetical protein
LADIDQHRPDRPLADEMDYFQTDANIRLAILVAACVNPAHRQACRSRTPADPVFPLFAGPSRFLNSSCDLKAY